MSLFFFFYLFLDVLMGMMLTQVNLMPIWYSYFHFCFFNKILNMSVFKLFSTFRGIYPLFLFERLPLKHQTYLSQQQYLEFKKSSALGQTYFFFPHFISFLHQLSEIGCTGVKQFSSPKKKSKTSDGRWMGRLTARWKTALTPSLWDHALPMQES